jgi:hypothetical protein
MTSTPTTTGQPGLRDQAISRLRKKRDLGAHLLAYVLVNAMLIGIWAVTGAGFFWPVFPLLGWGIGVAFHIWDIYQQPVSEEEIRREMTRMRQRSGTV